MVDRSEVRGDRRHNPADVRRIVPPVRVVAVLQSEQAAHGEHGGLVRVGGKQLRRPRVVADAVHNDQLRRGDRPSVGRRRLVGVRVGVRVRDDALDVDVAPAHLGGDAPPEVLGRDDPDDRAGLLRRHRPRGPARGRCSGGGARQPDGQREADRRDARKPEGSACRPGARRASGIPAAAGGGAAGGGGARGHHLGSFSRSGAPWSQLPTGPRQRALVCNRCR